MNHQHEKRLAGLSFEKPSRTALNNTKTRGSGEMATAHTIPSAEGPLDVNGPRIRGSDEPV